MPDLHPDDVIVISDNPDDLNPMTGKEAVVEVDPFLEGFYHAPYDPIYGAQAAGRLTGLAASRLPLHGWVRAFAGAFGAVLALASILMLASMFDEYVPGGPDKLLPLVIDAQSLSMTAVFAIAGVLMFVRAVRGDAA